MRSAWPASNPTPPAASPTPGCWPTHSVSSSTRSSPISSAADVPRGSNPRSRSRLGRRSSAAPVAGAIARGTLGGEGPLDIVSRADREARSGPGHAGPGDASRPGSFEYARAGPSLSFPACRPADRPRQFERSRSRMGQHVRGAQGAGGPGVHSGAVVDTPLDPLRLPGRGAADRQWLRPLERAGPGRDGNGL